MDRVNQIAELPLEKQANIENRDMSKQTALMGAEDGDPIAAVDFLLKKGADIEATNWCGDTPLLVAAELKKPKLQDSCWPGERGSMRKIIPAGMPWTQPWKTRTRL